MPKMFSNVLFYHQFGFYIVELLENYLFHVFMRRVHLTRSVRLFLPSPTDSSNFAYGAVLSQITNGQDFPIAFASKTFNKGENNKSIIEKELVAIHWAVNHFKPYVYGRKFTIRTDHRPLVYLFGMKNPTSKLTRIRQDLE